MKDDIFESRQSDRQWIRESNLIEEIDDPQEDLRSLHVWTNLHDRAFSFQTILDVHKGVMNDLRPDIAGRTRVVNVCVGNYIAPHWREVDSFLRMWVDRCLFYQGHTEAAFQVMHVDFEKIHPFEDGNGRVGRMLMNWQRVRAGLKPLCILASERDEYYKWFR